MTATPVRPLSRPPSPPDDDVAGDRPLRAAVPAALWALGAGFVCLGLPVLLVWAADSRSGSEAVDALRSAGQVWLLAHGVPLGLSPGRLSVHPLGLLLLPLGLLARAGGAAARQHGVTTLREAATLTAAVAGPYALVAAVVAGLCSTGAVRPSVLGAIVCASVVALLGAGAGVLRAAALAPPLLAQVPGRLRRLLPPAAAAVLVLLAAGAVLGGAALALSAGRAAELARATAPGAVGGVALLLLGLTLVPNAVVWAASWFTGAGFAVGTGTAVGPFAHELGDVPALPLLAALPSGEVPSWLAAAALAVPLLAGVLAGRLVARTAAASAGGGRPVRDALLVGPLAGALFALLAALSGGAAGGGRMSELGPSWWQSGLAVAVEVTVPAALTAWLLARRD